MTDAKSPTKRRLVICCDGTWLASNNIAQAEESNVAKFAQLVTATGNNEVGEKIPQIVYYQSGVGTSNAGNDRWLGRRLNSVTQFVQGFVGYGLAENVIEAYYFIVNNWDADTELFLCGFSRGAYTVRALSGILAELGVFSKLNMRSFPEAYKQFRNLKGDDWEAYKVGTIKEKGWIRETEVKVKVIGCWDTVGSLGVPETWYTGLFNLNNKWKFHRVALAHNVEYAFQALALEEHRRAYSPAMWHIPPQDDTPVSVHISIGGGATAPTSIKSPSYNRELSQVTLHWMVAQCAPFLDFSEEIRAQFDRKYQLYVSGKYDGGSKEGWVRGWTVKDSYGGLRSIGGSGWRMPGQYRPDPADEDKSTQDADSKYVSTDTHEYMHPAVRVRWATKDRKEWPPNLKEFNLRHMGNGGVMRSWWEWVKRLEDGREVVIPEMRFRDQEAGSAQLRSEILAAIQ